VRKEARHALRNVSRRLVRFTYALTSTPHRFGGRIIDGIVYTAVLRTAAKSPPPLTIISIPVQIAVWLKRADSWVTAVMGAQAFVCGLYAAPSLRATNDPPR